MACNIQNEVVTAQRDIFKEIKQSAQFKKAQNKLNDILTNGINIAELQAEQKKNGKKNLITKTERETNENFCGLPLNFIEVVEVKVKKKGTNFFYRLSENQYTVEKRRIGSARAGSLEAFVRTKKIYKEKEI